MADDPTPLGAPPKTLTRAQLLAKLKRKDEAIDIPGVGLVQGRSVSIEDAAYIQDRISNGNGSDPDTILMTTYLIAKTFPAFKDEDVTAIRGSDPVLYVSLAEAMMKLNNHIFNREDGAANLPLSFRKDAGTRKRVQRGKRTGP